MSTFEQRHEPAKFGGLPMPTVFLYPALLVFVSIAIVIPLLPIKLAFTVVAVGLAYQIYDTHKYYKNWAIRSVLRQGEKMKLWPTFGAKNVIGDVFCWKTFIGDHGLLLRDGSVSIAFRWYGVENRHFDDQGHMIEHSRRVALLKTMPTDPGVCIEHHFIRLHDDALINAYLREGEAMHQGDMPPIVRDCRQQLAELYRPMSRKNSVLTVLSMGVPSKKPWWSAFLPYGVTQHKIGERAYLQLLEIYDRLQNEYHGAQLLGHSEFQRDINKVLEPYGVSTHIDWRFDLSDQMITEKPVFKDRCIFYKNTYYKVLLLQNYPDINPSFSFKYCNAALDIHVSQILFPVDANKVLDKSKEDQDMAEAFTARTKGVEKSQTRVADMEDYRRYVAQSAAPVFDNCFVITISGGTPEELNEASNKLDTDVKGAGGLLREDEDVQREMFRARMPGLGRTALFARNDHVDTIADMMPFTVHNRGCDRPESLRISMSGQLVGFEPSRMEVAHELCVAETGGGKDTQYGLKVMETYKRIRWDFIEMGNSYQGVIEAIGGRYCRAKEQVINPLCSYADFRKAVEQEEKSQGKYRVVSPLIASQSITLLPLLKGLGVLSYEVSETIVVERTLRYCYENPQAGDAPTLPIVVAAFDKIDIDNDRQEKYRDELAERLSEWLKTETGRLFTQEDQFVISPIANAIDFAGVEGELLQYYMLFIPSRLASNAFARGTRGQIVLNEYKALLMKAPEPIRLVTVAIDRMGRKDAVGLTRITQGIKEIQSVDSEAVNSIPNRTLLGRRDQHAEIGPLLDVPPALTDTWRKFGTPKVMDRKGYREGMVCEADQWHHLMLKFPQIVLDLMNTRGEDKPLREAAYLASTDPYERIALLKTLQNERNKKDRNDVKDSAII